MRDIKRESNKERGRFFINDALLFTKHPEKYIRLIKADGHYTNKNFWKFLVEGCKLIKKVPIELMTKDPEISAYIPNELK